MVAAAGRTASRRHHARAPATKRPAELFMTPRLPFCSFLRRLPRHEAEAHLEG